MLTIYQRQLKKVKSKNIAVITTCHECFAFINPAKFYMLLAIKNWFSMVLLFNNSIMHRLNNTKSAKNFLE